MRRPHALSLPFELTFYQEEEQEEEKEEEA